MKIEGRLLWFNEQGAEGGFLALQENIPNRNGSFEGFHIVNFGDKIILWRNETKFVLVYKGKYTKKIEMLFFFLLNETRDFSKENWAEIEKM